MIERLHARSDRSSAAPIPPGSDSEDSTAELGKEFSDLLRQHGVSHYQPSGAEALGLAMAQAGLGPVERPQVPLPVRDKPAADSDRVTDEPMGEGKKLESGQPQRVANAGSSNQDSSNGARDEAMTPEKVPQAEMAASDVEVAIGETPVTGSVQASSEGDSAGALITESVTATSPQLEGEGADPEFGEEGIDVSQMSLQKQAQQADIKPQNGPTTGPVMAAVEELSIEPNPITTAESVQAQQQVAAPTSAREVQPKPDFLPPVGGSQVQAVNEAAIQLAALQQAFEQLRNPGGADRPNSELSAGRPQSNQISGVAAGSDARGLSNDVPARSARSLPKAMLYKAFERVESALKEVARSKDGKTLSIRLDPVDLGKVKVDVSLRDGGLHARIVPENAQVLAALRERAHELQSSLRKLGLDVDTITVAVSSESNESLTNGSFSSDDGKSFRDQWTNLPGKQGQDIETTIGNEIADTNKAGTGAQRNAVIGADHWIA
jgi:flagellar hook-length control protein FliK